MAQGEFTKEEATETKLSAEELFQAIPKSRRGSYVGHLNDILLFIDAAERKAPAEKKPATGPAGRE